MGRTVTAALVCLLAAGAAVAGGVGGGSPGETARPAAASPDAAAATDASAGREAGAGRDDVSVAADDAGVDVGVSLAWGGVSLATDGDGSGEGRVTHAAIDDGAADAGRAGACAVGFDEEGSPLDLAFDGANGSFRMAWSANASGRGGGERTDGVDPGEVVDECSSSAGGE